MTASVDALTDEIAAVIDRWLWTGGRNGPAIAAMAVLEVPEVRDGLRALRTLQALSEGHSWRSWGADSTSRSCTCGVPGCALPDVLADP